MFLSSHTGKKKTANQPKMYPNQKETYTRAIPQLFGGKL